MHFVCFLSRELAYQIAEQFRALGKPLGLKDCIIVGGMGKIIFRALPGHPLGIIYLQSKNCVKCL